MVRLRACVLFLSLVVVFVPGRVRGSVIVETDLPTATVFSNSRLVSDPAGAPLQSDTANGPLDYLPGNDKRSDMDRMLSALQSSLEIPGAQPDDMQGVIRYRAWPSLLLTAIALVMVGFALRQKTPVQARQRAVRYVARW